MAAPTMALAVLGVGLLVCVQGGCRAGPHPAPMARAGQASPVQQQHADDQWRMAAQQVTCALYGLHAESLVQHRDVGQVTLLEALAAIDQRKSQVVELRFFGGLSIEETAEVLKVSPETVKRDWKLAKAWLRRELRQQVSAPASRETPPPA